MSLSDPMPPRHGLLKCFACRKTVECDPEEMLRYTRDGWPKCCREVMTLFTPTDMTQLTRTIGHNAGDLR